MSFKFRFLAIVLLCGTLRSFAADTGVTVEIFERDIPRELKWPEKLGEATEAYCEQAFGFFRVPWKYIDAGVRQDRAVPYLIRASADVSIPKGKHRLLVRARGTLRVRIDDALVAELAFQKMGGNDRNPLKTDVLKLGNTRFLGPGDSEKLVEYESSGGAKKVVLETIVGSVRGKQVMKPETGETIIAIAPEGSDEFVLLSPSQFIPFTDNGWQAYVAQRSAWLNKMESDRRREAYLQHRGEIDARHNAARDWVKSHPAPSVPEGTDANPIDRFIAAKLAKAQAASEQEKGAIYFYESIRPILADRCFGCHSKKSKGGLRLNSFAAAKKGGESGDAGIVPGHPEKSSIISHVRSDDPDKVMPPKGDRLKPAEIALLAQWIAQGASWPDEEPATGVTFAPACDDLTFLRRVSLDVLGVPPTSGEARAFVADTNTKKREVAIDRLLDDPRWADTWTARWQDWLGENPSLVNGTLNNTGPFRWWLYESFLDRKPMDVFVGELVSMSGSPFGGGPAGFGVAGQNDAPMVAKAGVLASTFLATEMKCARCHDAPFHSSTQADLFHLAAMLARAPVSVPKSSTVVLDKLSAGGRKPLIKVTLKAGEPVAPSWSLTSLVADDVPKNKPADSRVKLGMLLTSPENQRFAEVMVNRVWSVYFGRGLVEPLSDWENATPSHPELLEWLAKEFVSHDYDLRHISRLILTSKAYQRQVSANGLAIRLYAAMPHRRATAEQIVDTLFSGFGVKMDVETLCIDLDAIRTAENGVNLGKPQRAWQFVYMSNDRDRPSLSLPRAQVIAELLTAFGWTGNRQEIISERKVEPNVLQSALLQNGTISRWLTRLSDESQMTQVALKATSAKELVREIFLRVLTREPTSDEFHDFTMALESGFSTRVTGLPPAPPVHEHRPYVAWSNHLNPDSNTLRLREAVEARAGKAPTQQLEKDWRERMEDVLWAVLNSPELIYLP